MAIIGIGGMRFRAFHGVFEEERRMGNDFEVDVRLDTGEMPLPSRDELSETLDYGIVYGVVQAEMEQPRNLLETLVARIGQRLLEEFPQVVSIEVRVTKENPPVAGACKHSWVEAQFKP